LALPVIRKPTLAAAAHSQDMVVIRVIASLESDARLDHDATLPGEGKGLEGGTAGEEGG